MFVSRHRLTQLKASMPDLRLTIGTEHVIPSSKVRNLGVVKDETLSLVDNISSVVRNASLKLRNISRILLFLPQ